MTIRRLNLLLIALIGLLSLEAAARVGGGESYSGGGSYSSSSSGGGGGGEGIGILIELLFRLVFYYPKVGIPLLIGCAVMYYFATHKSSADRSFDQLRQWSESNTVQRQKRADMGRFLKTDPNFSEPLFYDFVTLLVGRLYREQKDLGPLGAYLTQDLRQSLEADPYQGIARVLIGSLRILQAGETKTHQVVLVELELNLDFENGRGLYLVEQFQFQRRLGAVTPAPEDVYKLGCPNCGSPEPVDSSGICPYCETRVNDGRFTWVLSKIHRRHMAQKPKLVLSDGGAELGLELPTRKAADFDRKLSELKSSDPGFSLEEMQEFAAYVFTTLQQAWTEDRWEKARPYESDLLYQQHLFWLEQYRKDGIVNCLEEISVNRVEPVRVQKDRYFESLTFRIYASMKDYKRNKASGQVVCGDPNQIRHFSEYWTFVRRAGVSSQQREAGRCPSCGAPLDKVSVAGVCGYCQSNIVRGDFDWVLNLIEQDEAYVG